MCAIVIALFFLLSVNFLKPVASFSIVNRVPTHISNFCNAANHQLLNTTMNYEYLQDLRHQFTKINLCKDNFRLWFFQSLDVVQVEKLAEVSLDSTMRLNELLIQSESEIAMLREDLDELKFREIDLKNKIANLEDKIKHISAQNSLLLKKEFLTEKFGFAIFSVIMMYTIWRNRRTLKDLPFSLARHNSLNLVKSMDFLSLEKPARILIFCVQAFHEIRSYNFMLTVFLTSWLCYQKSLQNLGNMITFSCFYSLANFAAFTVLKACGILESKRLIRWISNINELMINAYSCALELLFPAGYTYYDFNLLTSIAFLRQLDFFKVESMLDHLTIFAVIFTINSVLMGFLALVHRKGQIKNVDVDLE
jgi:hypothetical protein